VADVSTVTLTMAHVEVLYSQGLSRVQQETNKPRRAEGKKAGEEKRLDPRTLREQINIRHPGVVDHSSLRFWKQVPAVAVTFIVGDLHRDRIEDKSCVLYFLSRTMLIGVFTFRN